MIKHEPRYCRSCEECEVVIDEVYRTGSTEKTVFHIECSQDGRRLKYSDEGCPLYVKRGEEDKD